MFCFSVSAIFGGSGGSVVQSSTPYLSTLSKPELETIGLKAVAAGIKPQQLREAYVIAQTNGDWSKLEILISGALGEHAITDSTANNAISGVTNFVSNLFGKFRITYT